MVQVVWAQTLAVGHWVLDRAHSPETVPRLIPTVRSTAYAHFRYPTTAFTPLRPATHNRNLKLFFNIKCMGGVAKRCFRRGTRRVFGRCREYGLTIARAPTNFMCRGLCELKVHFCSLKFTFYLENNNYFSARAFLSWWWCDTKG